MCHSTQMKSCGGTLRGLFVAGLLAATALGGFAATPANADTKAGNVAAWRPAVTERLVKLPGSSLKKAIDRDFSRSPLAEALRDAEAEIALKVQTLKDLQHAIDQADGEIQVELKHQFLAEKKEYLKLIQEQHKMRGKHLKTRIRVYQRLLGKLERAAAAKTPGHATLVQRQAEARVRLARTSERIDTDLFATSVTSNSKYAREYAKNMAAINALMARIEIHPMKGKLDVAGDAKDKPGFVRRLLVDAEADLQILQQESEIVGLMAKVVALDALGLSEEIAEEQPIDDDLPSADVAAAVDLFIN